MQSDEIPGPACCRGTRIYLLLKEVGVARAALHAAPFLPKGMNTLALVTRALTAAHPELVSARMSKVR